MSFAQDQNFTKSKIPISLKEKIHDFSKKSASNVNDIERIHEYQERTALKIIKQEGKQNNNPHLFIAQYNNTLHTPIYFLIPIPQIPKYLRTFVQDYVDFVIDINKEKGIQENMLLIANKAEILTIMTDLNLPINIMKRLTENEIIEMKSSELCLICGESAYINIYIENAFRFKCQHGSDNIEGWSQTLQQILQRSNTGSSVNT